MTSMRSPIPNDMASGALGSGCNQGRFDPATGNTVVWINVGASLMKILPV